MSPFKILIFFRRFNCLYRLHFQGERFRVALNRRESLDSVRTELFKPTAAEKEYFAVFAGVHAERSYLFIVLIYGVFLRLSVLYVNGYEFNALVICFSKY
jgi:hypothetical protein